MMRPQYANALTVSVNSDHDEVVVGFIHEYPVIPQDAKPETIEEYAKASDDIFGVVLSARLAHRLYDALGKCLGIDAEQSK